MNYLHLLSVGVVADVEGLFSQFLHRLDKRLGRDAEACITSLLDGGNGRDEILLAVGSCDGDSATSNIEQETIQDRHRVLACHHLAGSSQAAIESRA